MDNTKKVTYLKDYQAPHYFIDEVQLKFVLNEDETRVLSKLLIHANPEFANMPLVLDGEQLTLIDIAIDGEALPKNRYQQNAQSLTISEVPLQFILTLETLIKPQENTALSGLYRSHHMYCTQCEAQGFRRITYYIDRPDVLSKFTVVIDADKTRYPILLSNGNCINQGDLAHNRHWVEWYDPFKKPAYLFALVAGDLVCVQDVFITHMQRKIDLHIYVEKGNEERVTHAMEALKRAMQWDEKAYGREYDLDIYMIVAVKDFNMGAMENKGLNIFNAKYILANPQTATDHDYQYIEHVIGHEYFHNWSGNRVTLRDWFQLSLKEGFTVFREQQFAADMGSSSAQRIEQARHMRTVQFVEDAGPMSHAVRPDSYLEINNFYTMTVYEKGAEVIRMLSTLLGDDLFRKGTDLYFSRYDGKAATTDDFVATMQSVAQSDLTQFQLWYTQAGTPQLNIDWSYDVKQAIFTLNVNQIVRGEPMHIPLKIALLDETGVSHESVLEIKQAKETFIFNQITREPIPSLLREFSAPVKIKVDYTIEQLLFIAAHDTDAFCRWDAAQQIYHLCMLQLIQAHQAQMSKVLPECLIKLIRHLLTDKHQDLALAALMLQLPTQSDMAGFCEEIDVDAIHSVYEFLMTQLAHTLRNEFMDSYQSLLQTGPYMTEPSHIEMRALKNTCLQYLVYVDLNIAVQQFALADNMTDSLAALRALNNFDNPARLLALDNFYQKWQKDDLVLDKWFAIQAIANVPDSLKTIEQLAQHPAFDIKNPNKVSALIIQWSRNNSGFHQKDGKGYEFLMHLILKLDALNPQISARAAQVFTQFKRYDLERRELMRKTLQTLQKAQLSNDLYEIVNKSLNE